MTEPNKQERKIYGPKVRDFFEEQPQVIKAHSENDYTILPDNVTDPIVANNISNAEFDYTFNGGDDVEDKLFE